MPLSHNVQYISLTFKKKKEKRYTVEPLLIRHPLAPDKWDGILAGIEFNIFMFRYDVYQLMASPEG